MQKRNLLIIILFLFTGTIGWSAERIRQNFDFDWQFRLGEQGIYKPVQLPHDWSIELDFNEEVGPESGYLPGGIGYYKKDSMCLRLTKVSGSALCSMASIIKLPSI